MGPCWRPGTPLGPAERYDPATGTWTPAGELEVAGGGQTATLLRGGTVLLAGGIDPATEAGVATVQVFDPATGTWTTIAPMVQARLSGQAVELDDGRVLVIGGEAQNNGGGLASAEVYGPAGP